MTHARLNGYTVRLHGALASFLLLMLPVLGQAATYYVSPNGTGSGCVNGGQAVNQMRNSVSGGIGCLSSGDTLVAKAGTYVDAIRASDIPSGSAGAPTTVRSEVQYGAILRPNNATPMQYASGVVVMYGRQHIVFEGFTIDMSDVNLGAGVGIDVGSGSQEITLQNLEVRNWLLPTGYGTGIYVGYDTITGTNYVRNNKVHTILGQDAGGLGSMGMYITGNNTIVEGNEIWNISQMCTEQWSGVRDAQNNPVRPNNNTFRNNFYHNCAGTGLHVSSGTNTRVYNNIFANNGTDGTKNNYGLQVGGAGWSTDNVSVYNNTFYNNGHGNGAVCILVRSDATSTNVRNNICWQNAQDTVWDMGVSTTQTHNLLGVNPLFVNASGGDFHVTPTSPAISAGINISTMFTTDYAGTVRPAIPTPWTIGAYEGAAVTLSPSVGVFFIDDTGTNTSDCDAAKGTLASPSPNPFGSYSVAFQCMLGGSTLYFRAGAYPALQTSVAPVIGGTVGTPTVLARFAAELVTITGYLWLDRSPSADKHLVFDGFVVDAGGLTNAFTTWPGGAESIIFRNGEMHSGGNELVYLLSCLNCRIEQSSLHGNGSASYPLVSVITTTNAVLSSNDIWNGSGTGVQTSAGAVGTLIEKNRIRNHAGTAVVLGGSSTEKLYNNLIYSNVTAVQVQTGESGAWLYHNTAWNNSTACMIIAAGVTSSEARNNICWASTVITNNAGAGITLTPNQTTDPAFLSTVPGDPQFLRLAVGSTARDSGVVLAAVTSDIAGNARPSGAGADMPDQGAYEETFVQLVTPDPVLITPFKTTFHLFP